MKGNPNPNPATRFQPGNPGRPPGIPNKLTQCMKAQTWKVFEELDADPELSLSSIARKNPLWFYTVFSSKLIAQNLNLTLTLEESWERATDEEKWALIRKIEATLPKGIEE